MTDAATTNRYVIYRLLPRKRSVHRWLEKTLEDQRHLYNAALEERIDCYSKTGKSISYIDQCKSLTVIRKDPLTKDMVDTSLNIQRGTIKRLDEAYRAFFRRAKEGAGKSSGFPKFRGRNRWESFTIAEGVKVGEEWIGIPKFGRISARRKGGTRYPEGVPTVAQIALRGGKWYAAVSLRVEVPVREDDGTAVGIDMGVAKSVTLSDGQSMEIPDRLRILEGKVKRHQKKLSRMKKGSNRRRKQKATLARAAKRVADYRKTWQHGISRDIADASHTVCVEKLQIKNMTKSAKGNAEEHGKNVAQKSGLNREILRQSWAQLRQMLAYKSGRLIEVNPAHTSQTCSECGTVDSRSRRSQSEFVCVACGHEDNADVNAAKNILAKGLEKEAVVTAASARGGETAVGRPVKREINVVSGKPLQPSNEVPSLVVTKGLERFAECHESHDVAVQLELGL